MLTRRQLSTDERWPTITRARIAGDDVDDSLSPPGWYWLHFVQFLDFDASPHVSLFGHRMKMMYCCYCVISLLL